MKEMKQKLECIYATKTRKLENTKMNQRDFYVATFECRYKHKISNISVSSTKLLKGKR